MKKIPKKNYILLGIISVVTILLLIITNGWIKTYKLNKSNTSPLTASISKINKNELHLSLAESNQVILYVGYTQDSSIRKLEKEMLKKIKSKNLNEYIIYYDVTKELKKDAYLKTLKSEFPEIETKLFKAPMFIYVKNGEALDINDSKDELITIDDFNSLIEKYEIGE